MVQFVRFVFTGATTATIDFFVLVFLVEVTGINYLIAAAGGFLVRSTLNYIVSVKWVFEGGKFPNLYSEFSMFMLFTLFGLCLNQTIMFLGVTISHMVYTHVKIVALFLVTVFNYITKKLVVFKR